MRAINSLVSLKLASSADSYTSVRPNVEIGADEAVEVSVDGDGMENKVTVRPFDLQTYRCQKIELIILQVGEVPSLLCPVSQNHGNDLLEFLRFEQVPVR